MDPLPVISGDKCIVLFLEDVYDLDCHIYDPWRIKEDVYGPLSVMN
jgi:hypothetical protein